MQLSWNKQPLFLIIADNYDWKSPIFCLKLILYRILKCFNVTGDFFGKLYNVHRCKLVRVFLSVNQYNYLIKLLQYYLTIFLFKYLHTFHCLNKLPKLYSFDASVIDLNVYSLFFSTALYLIVMVHCTINFIYTSFVHRVDRPFVFPLQYNLNTDNETIKSNQMYFQLVFWFFV